GPARGCRRGLISPVAREVPRSSSLGEGLLARRLAPDPASALSVVVSSLPLDCARGRLRNPSRVPCASLPALRPTSPVRARRPSPATRHRAPCPSLSALRTLVPEPRAKPGAPPKIPPFSPFCYNLIRYTFQRI